MWWINLLALIGFFGCGIAHCVDYVRCGQFPTYRYHNWWDNVKDVYVFFYIEFPAFILGLYD